MFEEKEEEGKDEEEAEAIVVEVGGVVGAIRIVNSIPHSAGVVCGKSPIAARREGTESGEAVPSSVQMAARISLQRKGAAYPPPPLPLVAYRNCTMRKLFSRTVASSEGMPHSMRQVSTSWGGSEQAPRPGGPIRGGGGAKAEE